jgi:hypothetical protein
MGPKAAVMIVFGPGSVSVCVVVIEFAAAGIVERPVATAADA